MMAAAAVSSRAELGDVLARHGRQQLRSLRWWRVSLPLRTALHHASAYESAIESVVIAADVDGQLGYAEVRANGSYATGETADDIEAGFRVGTPLGSSVAESTEAVLARSKLAAMAIDIAAWDALGVSRALPVHRLLGAPETRQIVTHAQIGFGDVETATRLAERFCAIGFTRLKVRVGASDEASDLARLSAIRGVAGPGVSLVADANGGWTLGQTLKALPELERLDIEWLEQPVKDDDDLARVTSARRVRIRADESARDAAAVTRLAEAGAVNGVHLKLEKAGTVARLIEAIEAAERGGLAVAFGQMDQGRLGCAATTQVAAGLGFSTAELWGWAEIEQDLAGPLILNSGAVQVPQTPGLGVAVTLSEPPLCQSLKGSL